VTATATPVDPHHAVRIVTPDPLPLAVVHRTLHPDALQAVWPPALDEVWAFVRTHGLKAGRNVFVYRPAQDQQITLEAGVELSSPLPANDHVFSSQTPTGRAVTAEHRGSYDGIPLAHTAIRRHCAAAGLQLAGPSWEVYGHYPSDQTPPLTEVFYLLAE
jgi:effector-binding domain-containing protein